MDSETDKIIEFVAGGFRQSAPPVLKISYRLIWILPLLFVVLFPLAFVNRSIHADDAWIGEQVHSLVIHGYIVTDFFRDYPPIDKTIVIYHKLTVWAGAIFATILGWGLYQLRLVSAISGLVLLITFYFFIKSIESRRIAALACLILLWSPAFWEQMRIFRPEMLMTCLGLVSFMILFEGYMKQSVILTALAGAFAGWSGLAHPIGLLFMLSGAIALICEKEIKLAVILAVTACLAFIPYLMGLLVNWKLFHDQLFNNGAMAFPISFEWHTLILNFLNEHKRIFRGPGIFGISILFILSLFYIKRSQIRENRFIWIYFGAFFVLEALAPLIKDSRYSLPLTPFFALIIARTIYNFNYSGTGWRKAVNIIFFAWFGIFVLYGAFALGYAALVDRAAPKEIETNRLMGEKIKTSSVVMAPFNFIFNQIDNFTIQSWYGCEKALGKNMTPSKVEEYAARHGVEYIIVNNEFLEKMHITYDQLGSSFRQYTPLFVLPKRARYLLMKTHRAPEIVR